MRSLRSSLKTRAGRLAYRFASIANAVAIRGMARFSHHTAFGAPEYRATKGTSATDSTWVEVGANHGGGLARAPEGARVFAFEPNLTLAAALAERHPNVTVIPCAVSEHDGFATFHLNADDATSSLLPLDPEGAKHYKGIVWPDEDRTVIVPTIRLDTFMKQAGIAHIDFLTVDAQGSDLAVIRSLGQLISSVDVIQVEAFISTPQYLGADNTVPEIQFFMREHGFRQIHERQILYGQAADLVFTREVLSDSVSSTSQD